MIAIASLAFSARTLTASELYRLAAEDIVCLTVLRHPEFSGEFLIPQDGKVNLPAIGMVKASGMTLQELSDYVTKHLSDRLRSPEVSSALKTQGMQRVYVLGSVKLPGVYDYKPGWRIAQCIAAAGGYLGEASECQARLIKASTGEQSTVKLENLLDADSDTDLPVEPGDVLSIELVRTLPVYVTGTVKNPGMYKLREDGGVLEAITLAGGPLDTAALSGVTITHLSGKNDKVDLVPLMRQGISGANPRLEPGDLVVVPESNKKIAVLGNVAQAGSFPLRDGEEVRLVDALALAGGMVKQSNLESVLVISMHNGREDRKTCNLAKFLQSGDSASNPIVEPGNIVFVGKNNGANWPALVSGLSVTSLIYNILTR